jgi:hypothetical protein
MRPTANIPTIAILFLALLESLATAQFNLNPQQLNNFVGNLLDGLGGSAPPKRPVCIPYNPGSEYKTLQDWCKALSLADDKFWDEKYRTASGPAELGAVFPMQGCVLGCMYVSFFLLFHFSLFTFFSLPYFFLSFSKIAFYFFFRVGKDAFSNANRWGAGAWSGKCIRSNGAAVVNLLSPVPSIGGMFNVLDTFNWSSMLPVMEQFPGSIAVGPSWWDAYNLVTSRSGSNGGTTSRGIRDAWTITYDDVPIPPLNGESNALQRTLNMYAQLVKGSRDEVRQVAPGFLLGQLFRRPNSFLNPTPLPINNGIRFAMIQVCDKQGNFANGGNQRYLKPKPR